MLGILASDRKGLLYTFECVNGFVVCYLNIAGTMVEEHVED
jgi:hypothetical protein